MHFSEEKFGAVGKLLFNREWTRLRKVWKLRCNGEKFQNCFSLIWLVNDFSALLTNYCVDFEKFGQLKSSLIIACNIQTYSFKCKILWYIILKFVSHFRIIFLLIFNAKSFTIQRSLVIFTENIIIFISRHGTLLTHK